MYPQFLIINKEDALCYVSTYFSDFFSIQCEPDEYFALVNQMKMDNIVRTHGNFLKSHKNAFSGQDFRTWILEKKELGIFVL